MVKVNQAEFAKMHGVSRKTVTTWKARGWLVMDDNDVDVEASNHKIEHYRKTVTHPAKGNKEGNKVTGNKETPAQAAERIVLELGADMDFDEARRVKENYFALTAKLEYEEKAKWLLPWKDMVQAVSEEYAHIRTRLIAIAPEHGPRLKILATTMDNQQYVEAFQNIVYEVMDELRIDKKGANISKVP